MDKGVFGMVMGIIVHAPIRAMLAIFEDIPDQIEILMLLVGSCRVCRGRRGCVLSVLLSLSFFVVEEG